MASRKITSFLILSAALFVTGCSQFDKSAIPLYDDVFVLPEEDKNAPRKSPVKNPMMMPPGYKRPTFNNNQGSEEEQMQQMIQVPKRESSSYPRLSTVPEAPENIPQPKSYQRSHDELEMERNKALQMQKEILSEKTAIEEMPSELPDTERKFGDSLTDNVAPITIIEPDGSMAEEAIEPEIVNEETHNFGAPQEVKGGGASTRTEMYDVGYDSEEEMERDNDQFKLKPFEYKNTPRINNPVIKAEPEANFSDDAKETPRFLPESRYKARRLTGPVYRGSYNGRTYFPNE